MMRYQEENGCNNSNLDCNQTINQFGVEESVLGLGVLIPNRDSPNGYSTVMPAELQSVTLSH